MAEDVTLTWQMWAGGDADVAGWQQIADLVHDQISRYHRETRDRPLGRLLDQTLGAGRIGQLTDIISMQSLRTPNFHQLMEPLNSYVDARQVRRQRLRPLDHRRHVRGR